MRVATIFVVSLMWSIYEKGVGEAPDYKLPILNVFTLLLNKTIGNEPICRVFTWSPNNNK